MIIHRFVFLAPVQLPGRAPAILFEPAAANNIGFRVTRTEHGWLFIGAPGVTSGLSASGREELEAIGEDPAAASLAVLVPHSQVIVQYAGDWTEDVKFPTSAPSDAPLVARKPPPPPPAETSPPPPPPPMPAARRRGPAGASPAPPPPPSVGWVADE